MSRYKFSIEAYFTECNHLEIEDKEKGAISEDTAISLDNLGILKQSLDLVQILINDKVLIKTKDNKYYINIKK